MTNTNTELTADAILGANDLVTESVSVPEWGGFVRVRGLTGMERDSFEQDMINARPQAKGRKPAAQTKIDNLRASLVARCIVSEAGTRLFADSQIPALGKKSAAALNRVYEVAARLSGIGEDDVEELVEDFSEGTLEPSTSV